MTNWKKEAVLAYAQRLKDFEEANPDVGYGYPWSWFVEQALKHYKLKKEDVGL